MSGPIIDLGGGNDMSEEHQNMVDALLDVESGLSEKELNFIDDLDKRRNRPLTEKQADWLESIYERLC